jgi:hypothetical protein
MYRWVIVSVMLLLSALKVEAQVPVILRATSSEQHDTIGCNFIKELCRISYVAILEGKAKLWDSPAKEIQLFAPSLLEIERSSQTKFEDQEIVFIYEMWNSVGKDLKSTTTGFLFSNVNSVGEEVAYGYVEYSDLQEACLRSRIMMNANGNYNSTLAAYIYSKNFNYKILQFAGKVIDNATDSRLIKEDFIGNRKFNTSSFATNEVAQKMVGWNLDFGAALTGAKADSSRLFIASLTTYLMENEELLYNLGGDKIMNPVLKGKWKITRVEFRELWKKINSEVLCDPSSMVVFINDIPLTEIPYRDMIKMEFKVGALPWLEFIKSKSYALNITSINNQEIQRSESFIYLKALNTYDWNKVTEFVKFY